MTYKVNEELVNKYVGKVVTKAWVQDDTIFLKFGNNGLCVYDDAQFCCEERYITTDDAISDLVGGKLRHITTREGSIPQDGGLCHDIDFLEIATDQTHVTFETHNEHSGCYGGFHLVVEEI